MLVSITPQLLMPALSAPRGAALYDGIVSTRGTMPSHVLTTAGCNARSGYFARSDISKLRILALNCYALETAPGNSVAITSSIEFPAGVFTQLTFSGSSTGTIPDGGLLLSDYVNVTIPNGEKYWIRTFRQGATLVFENGVVAYNDNAYMGDVLNFTNSDQTMSGAVTNVGENSSYHPVVIAPISIPSICMFGDSITAGLTDIANISGDMGAIARSIGSKFGYFNGGVNGEKVSDFLAHNTQRLAISQYASAVIFGYPTNDIFQSGDSKATVETHMSSAWALVSPKPTFQVTTVPQTTSTDSWATTTNQTIPNSGKETVRVGWNTDLRGGGVGPNKGFFDIASVVESSLNSGLWVPNDTTDGVHPDAAGCLSVVASGVIDTSRIGTVPGLPPESGSAWGATGTLLTTSATRRTNDTVSFPTGNSLVSTARGAASQNAGKFYFELEILGISNGTLMVGLMDGTASAGAAMDDYLGDTPLLKSYSQTLSDGTAINFNTGTIFTAVALGVSTTLIGGDVLQVAADFTNKFAYLGLNGAWFLSGVPTSGASGTGHAALWTGSPTLFPALTFNHMTGYVRLRTSNLLYAPPSGYSAWG